MQTALPQHCEICAARSGNRLLCEGCARDLPWHEAASCPVCALPTPLGETCGACLGKPPAFDRTIAPFDYAAPLDTLVLRLKYGARLPLVRTVAEPMIKRLKGEESPDLIVPMPLSKKRLAERGFNQAAEIAKPIAAWFQLPLDLDACARVRETRAQAELPWKERRKNVRRAFACQRDFSGKTVALVDDVMTTGATMNELAREVKKAGAARVLVWVVARTLRLSHV